MYLKSLLTITLFLHIFFCRPTDILFVFDTNPRKSNCLFQVSIFPIPIPKTSTKTEQLLKNVRPRTAANWIFPAIFLCVHSAEREKFYVGRVRPRQRHHQTPCRRPHTCINMAVDVECLMRPISCSQVVATRRSSERPSAITHIEEPYINIRPISDTCRFVTPSDLWWPCANKQIFLKFFTAVPSFYFACSFSFTLLRTTKYKKAHG